jgi:DNA-binding CsgD family transcriptional regulator
MREVALADRCEAANTPGLAELAAATPLTDREADVAMLAAQGHTTREVAERLCPSASTVDNHLQRMRTGSTMTHEPVRSHGLGHAYRTPLPNDGHVAVATRPERHIRPECWR